MKNFDKYSYCELHEMVEEVLNALKEGRSINSCEKLLDFLDEDLLTQEFLERMKSPELYMQYYNKRMRRDKELDVMRLVDELNHMKGRMRRLRKIYVNVSIAVASVLILVSMMWQFIFWDSDKKSLIISEQKIIPYEKPTLILDDGTVYDVQKLISDDFYVACGIDKMDSEQITYTEKEGVINESKYNVLIIPAGYVYKVLLADGSEVILNAGSRLKYPVAGNSNLREVELEGEAFFKVTKSTEPFRVKMGPTDVKVYGTQFNVSHEIGGDIEVVLVEGSVGFNTLEKEIRLEPSQRCGYSIEKNQMNVSNVNVKEYMAWLDNKFDYDQVPLEYFLKKVSTWYGVYFKYDKKDLENIIFYISVSRDIVLSDLLLLIEKSTKLTFIRESENEFTIKNIKYGTKLN